MIICSPIRPSLSPSPAHHKRQFTIMIKCCAQKWCEPLENCLIPNTMIDQSHSHGGGYWVGEKKKSCVVSSVFAAEQQEPQLSSDALCSSGRRCNMDCLRLDLSRGSPSCSLKAHSCVYLGIATWIWKVKPQGEWVARNPLWHGTFKAYPLGDRAYIQINSPI